MNAMILHSGFDDLKFTVQTEIPPELRAELVAAKTEAIRTNADIVIEKNGIALAVRRSGGMAFSAHTGEYGAEWHFLDPENRPANNPGVTVDFRALLLATGGLQAAERYFREFMAAFGIPYIETQLRVSRVDFAVDFLAPWFEPDREALVVPPGTRIREYTSVGETETHSTGARVTGFRAGAIANRQLGIYDKRAEVIATGKKGWLPIWNDALAQAGRPPLDLSDRNQSQVWRFELRMGAKQLRNRWEMRSWFDLSAIIGDAYAEFCSRIRYCIQQPDSNRSRWPVHELWEAVREVIACDLSDMRSGVAPNDVKTANREAHKRMLDMQLLGLMVSRAAAEGISDQCSFEAFSARQYPALAELSRSHPVPVDERLGKAAARYLFR